jgi:hypothetical protein
MNVNVPFERDCIMVCTGEIGISNPEMRRTNHTSLSVSGRGVGDTDIGLARRESEGVRDAMTASGSLFRVTQITSNVPYLSGGSPREHP